MIVDRLLEGSDGQRHWKAVGIGGGDTGAIFGCSPFATAYELWEIKTKRKPRPDLSGLPHIEKGNLMEVIARKSYEELTGIIVPAMTMVHDVRHWQKAAMDGVSQDLLHGVEIKYVADEMFQRAVVEKFVPEHYRLQCLHYVVVGEFKTFDFIACNGAGEITIVDLEWTAEELLILIETETEFYRCIIQDEEPGKTENDVDDLTGNNEFESLMYDYADLQIQASDLKKKIDAKKKTLEGFATRRSVRGLAGKVSRYWVTGQTDTKAFLDDRRFVIPDSYRKKGKWQYRITPAKELKA